MAALDIKAAELQNDKSENKSSLRMVLIVGVLVVVGAIFALAWQLGIAKETNAEREISRDMHNFVFSRNTELNAWLSQLEDNSKVITNADTFKLFAEEVLKMGDDVVVILKPTNGQSAIPSEQDDRLNTQLMRTYLIDGIVKAEFSSGRMVNQKGATYLATESVPAPLNNSQIELVQQVMKTGRKAFAPVYQSPTGLTLDMYLPIFPVQYTNTENVPATVSTPAAVLMVSKSVTSTITKTLSVEYPVKGVSNLHILQKNSTAFQDIAPAKGGIREISGIALDENNDIPFAVYESIDGNGLKVYHMGMKIRELDWWVIQELNYDKVREPLNSDIQSIYIYAGLLSMVITLAVGVLWWWFAGNRQKQVLGQFQELFAVIDEQKRLLDGINSTISDPISLTDAKGVYRYVNRAFAMAVGRDPHEVPGLDTAAVFGFDTAKRLNSSDQHVLMTAEALTTNEVIWLQSRKHYFQISKTPLREAGTRTPVGIVSVFHDLTQVMETEEHSRRVVQQTINALVQAIEEADPFLGGHSRIMGGIATLIAKTMQLSDTEVATIQAAANLSQIGKMYIPREILVKPGALTEEEKKVMEQHIEHTKSIVSEIEFDLPVSEAIYQMHERLDGKGYPLHLTDKDISIYARVLAVANAFTAMARPRSYRPALAVEDVLNALEQQTGSYDQNVVRILREVLQTPSGERYVHIAANSKTE